MEINKSLIGLISGGLVILSVVPYAIRVRQGKIKPNLTTWSLWSLIGLALLLTYKSSGAEANIWPAVFAFTNPIIITVLALRQHGYWPKPSRIEKFCFLFGLLTLLLWLKLSDNPSLVQYALYLAIIADLCAAIPTLIFVWHKPFEDRPLAWGMFSLAYGLAMLAVPEHTFANYVLPIYMSVGSGTIAMLLVVPRIKSKTPLREWI